MAKYKDEDPVWKDLAEQRDKLTNTLNPDPVVKRACVEQEKVLVEFEYEVPKSTAKSLSLKNVTTLTYPLKVCGPAHGGLVCPGATEVCAAKAGVCVDETTRDVGAAGYIKEYSRNWGAVADNSTQELIAQTERDMLAETLAKVPGANVANALTSEYPYRDFPIYSFRVALDEVNIMNMIKVKDFAIEVHGSLVDPANEDLEQLVWDGEAKGTLALDFADAMGGAEAGIPQFEGSLTVATHFHIPPGGDFALSGVVVSGDVGMGFGGSKEEPACQLSASATFPIPCGEGQQIQVDGSLAFNNLGGIFSARIVASGTFYCGYMHGETRHRGAKVAKLLAYAAEPIVIDVFSISQLHFEALIVNTPSMGLPVSATGSIVGKVNIETDIGGLSIFGSIKFDTLQGRMLAEAFIEYRMPVLSEDKPSPFGARLGARIPIGYCDAQGYMVYGNATLNIPPYFYAEVSVMGRKHCEGDFEAQAKYGHVWYFRLDIPVVSIYEDIFRRATSWWRCGASIRDPTQAGASRGPEKSPESSSYLRITRSSPVCSLRLRSRLRSR